MHADICDPKDPSALDRFIRVLHEFCAVKINEGWGGDVHVVEYRIGDQSLTVFSDHWNIDIEGPDALVKGIVDAMTAMTQRDEMRP